MLQRKTQAEVDLKLICRVTCCCLPILSLDVICVQVDNAEASKKSTEERAELFAKMIAAFNEAKGYIRQSLSAGKAVMYVLYALNTLNIFSAGGAVLPYRTMSHVP